MDRNRLQRLQALLEQDKRELLAVVDRLTGPGGLESPQDEADRELSAYDNHPADYGSQLYERSKDLGLLEAVRLQIAEIDEAQEAILAGNYGICQNCGESIPEQRLLALPSTVLCVKCKRETEREDASPRPVEEGFLEPPLERQESEATDYAFDQDDAWEEVARFGTSSDIVEKP